MFVNHGRVTSDSHTAQVTWWTSMQAIMLCQTTEFLCCVHIYIATVQQVEARAGQFYVTQARGSTTVDIQAQQLQAFALTSLHTAQNTAEHMGPPNSAVHTMHKCSTHNTMQGHTK